MLIWIIQGTLSFIFIYSGLNKFIYKEELLVKKGQTGVEGLNKWLIKFIGFSEVLGSIGLVLPYLVDRFKVITPIAAICLGSIMVPAAVIHWKRKEYKSVTVNILILILSGLIAYYRY